MSIQIFEQVGALWWNLIAVAALKSTLIFLLAAAAAWLLRGSSPSVRFRVWLGGMLSAAAIPLLGVLTPELPLLPGWLNADAWFAAGLGSGESTALAQNGFLSWALAAGVMIWFTGFLWHGGRAMLAAALLHQVARSSRRLAESHPLTRLCRDLQSKQGVSAPVELYAAAGEARPLAWGVFYAARLLLPESAAGWDEQRAKAVLLHELEHVRRRDALVQILEQVICAVYWFHPLVWLASARMRFEREAACDDAVLAAGVLPTDYAESLLALSHPDSHAWRAPVLAAPMAETRALTRRIREILSVRRVRNQLPVLPASAAIVGFAMLLLLLSSLAPAPMQVHPVLNLAETLPMSFGDELAAPATNPPATPGRRAAFAARLGSPVERSLRESPDWRGDARLLGAALAENANDPMDLETFHLPGERSQRDAALSLDDLARPASEAQPQIRTIRRSPTDTHGRVSQTTFSGRPMPL